MVRFGLGWWLCREEEYEWWVLGIKVLELVDGVGCGLGGKEIEILRLVGLGGVWD